MIFADLTDTNFEFKCDLEKEDFLDKNYYFKIMSKYSSYLREYTRDEVEQLRDNCERILSATRFITRSVK
jgi:hypothetical protein